MIKKILVMGLVVAAAVWGFSKGLPEWRGEAEREEKLTKLTVKNFAAATAAEGVLVVVNVEKEPLA